MKSDRIWSFIITPTDIISISNSVLVAHYGTEKRLPEGAVFASDEMMWLLYKLGLLDQW